MSEQTTFQERLFSLFLSFALGMLVLLMIADPLLMAGQVETVPGAPAAFVWQHRLQIQGHLALNYSPAGAFSPDNAHLAVVEGGRVAVVNLRDGSVEKVLNPRFPNVSNLMIQSASFISPTNLFMLASGVAGRHHRRGAGSPELGFQWDVAGDTLASKVDQIGAGGGFLPARYFPRIGYLALYKDSNFDVWNPVTGRGGRITLPELTHPAHLYQFSPDGHWLILAQIEANASPNPVIVLLRSHQFVNVLAGHQGPVLSISFSRDSSKVATACADGKVRIFSAPGWKLLQTLSGHTGPVHWVDFSPNGDWIASAGEDSTARVWSVETSKLIQTLSESSDPLATVAFSPDGRYLAATSDRTVHVWERTPIN